MAKPNLVNRIYQKDGKWYRIKTHFADILNVVEIKENTKRAKMNAPMVRVDLKDVQQNILDQLNLEIQAGDKRIKNLVREAVQTFK